MSVEPFVVLGGTFDPVHLGHLRVAWEAGELLQAPVHLMPARQPPHRAPTVASADQRVAMLQAALAGQDRLRLDARELRREGPSYSVDTLTELRAELGPERPLVLLVGADAFAGLDRWHRWRALFELAHVGVLTRPGQRAASGPALEAEVGPRRRTNPGAVRLAPAGAVVDLHVTALAIAASHIRALLGEGRSPRFLVPDPLIADARLLDVYRNRS
jgi:nicotinate-nucleotide adenylyltransferase